MSQIKAKIMAATVKASDEGLEIVDRARRKKGWNKNERAWAGLALTTPATLKRFWQGIRIQSTAFQLICETVGVSDWESIADFEESASDGQIGPKRLSFAIAGSIDEIDKHKLEAITALLRDLSGDASIKILGIYEGSIKIILGGSSEALERIESLFKSGQLDEVEGIAVQEVSLLSQNELLQLMKDKRGNAVNLSRTYLSEADLIEADLVEADLFGADLSGAFLSEADLRRANLCRAILLGADLRRANLAGADLSGADLVGADLRETDLRGANLREAILRRATLAGADLSGADLSGADVSRTRFSSTTQGLSEERRQDLIEKGAIFEDTPGEESFILSPVPSGRR